MVITRHRKDTMDQHWRNRVHCEAQLMDVSTNQALAICMQQLNQALEKGTPLLVSSAREALAQMLQETQTAISLRAQVLDFSQGSPLPSSAAVGDTPIYCIASTTLAEAMAYLTHHLPGAMGEPEWMLAVTGLKRGNLRTLENLIEVQLSSQSATQAAFDVKDFTRIAVVLHEHGQALHAIFHSHRFKGPPHPSGIDKNLQRILEEGGYPTIQAVFSEDGYVRFFACRPFTLEVFGKGVMSIEGQAYLYHIIQFDTLPHPPSAVENC